MLAFINDITDTLELVSPEIKEEAWGYLNRLMGLGHYTPRQAYIEEMRIASMRDLILMSIPAWKVTPKFLLGLESFENFGYIQVWRATSSSLKSEREHISEHPGEYGGQQSQQRKRRFGIF